MPTPTELYRDERSDVRFRSRQTAVHVQGALYCPAGHPIGDTRIALDQHTFRCSWEDPRSKDACRAIIFVIGHWTTPDGTRFTLAAPVTFDEVQRMRTMSAPERLAYLHLTWSPHHAD